LFLFYHEKLLLVQFIIPDSSYLKLPPLTKSNKDAFDLGEIKLLWEDYNKGNDFTGYILIMILPE